MDPNQFNLIEKGANLDIEKINRKKQKFEKYIKDCEHQHIKLICNSNVINSQLLNNSKISKTEFLKNLDKK